MAFENPGNPVTLDASTGLRQYRGVQMSGTSVAYPSASTIGQPIVGVICGEGTTGSTVAGYTSVQWGGIAKMEAAASTLAAGDWVSCSTIGQAQPATNAGDHVIGKIVSGSSGAANRIVSVLLGTIGSSVAPS